MKRSVIAVLLTLALGAPVLAAPRSYEAFLRDVTDLPRLAKLPPVGETCKQFSSYDRASTLDAAGNQIHWDANGDAGKFLRQDPEGAVLAEMDGPGCITRIWSANPAGTLKIYIDSATTPTFQADFNALTTGKLPEIPEPITGLHARGGNCFLPFPYQKRCKVVVEKPGPLYYHVDYRSYPAGTAVEPFRWPLTDAQRQTLARVCATLSHCGDSPYAEKGTRREQGRATLAPGGKRELIRLRGARAITALKLSPALPQDTAAARKALQGLQLAITFDGAARPQVLAPLGDFFGTAPGLNLYRSLPMGVTEAGGYCYWYMPFARDARIQVFNRGGAPVSLSWAMTHAPLAQPFAGLMHFHAGWRREAPNSVFDWPLLEASGRGRFVGTALSVWNPVSNWWGEGDEKVWVDGERFPSWFGTGSEDYFGYAWCSTELFTHALHAQPLCEGPGNANYTSVNRWHIADNIPFQQSYRMTLENYGKDKDYAAMAYWYQAPGGSNFFAPTVAVRELHPPRLRFLPGVQEGENLPILARQIATVGPQGLSQYQGSWSGDTHLWLRPAGAGEWVDLGLAAPKAGRYAVTVYLTRAIDYGILRFRVNGQPLGEPIDCFHDGVMPTGPISLGTVKLPAGQSVLRLEVVGKNPQATGFMAGLDAVLLKKL